MSGETLADLAECRGGVYAVVWALDYEVMQTAVFAVFEPTFLHRRDASVKVRFWPVDVMATQSGMVCAHS